MRQGFTLIEVLVVVVVILILLGIAAGIGAWASRTSEEALTKTALLNTQLIFDEYASMGTNLSGWAAGSPGVSTLVALTKYTAAYKVYYAKLPPKIVDAPGNRINDGWGNSLLYVPAGIAWSGNPNRNAPYFMSAGPDGNATTIGDNLYSFAVLK